MKTAIPYVALILIATLLPGTSLQGQKKKNAEAPKGYSFTIENSLPATSVKDQHRTGTCWSYAATSFIESELLRTGKGEHDLSEMFFVRKAYEMKADKYVRMHGKTNFGQGGLAMDVTRIWKEFGMLPNEAYPGLTVGDSLPVHGEMEAVLSGYVDQVIRNRNRRLSSVWKHGFLATLDAYMGELPEKFSYQGSTYTPQTFATDLGLDPDAYVSIGSFTHHPFYSSFMIEIPDNWLWSSIYNVSCCVMLS
jgi:bleomycin hydrolase